MKYVYSKYADQVIQKYGLKYKSRSKYSIAPQDMGECIQGCDNLTHEFCATKGH